MQPQNPAPNDILTDGDLRGRSLSGIILRGGDLREADLILADLTGADLSEAQLTTATAHGARMRGASLHNAILRGFSARDVDLEGALLAGADLRDAELRNAVLLEADLSGADLRGANLRGADLRRANLCGAILDGTTLDKADLAGAYLEGAQISGISARGARIQSLQDPSVQLIEALRAAGAQARPPLAIGQLVALLGLLTTSSLRHVASAGRWGWTTIEPLRQRVGPAVRLGTGLLGPIWVAIQWAAVGTWSGTQRSGLWFQERLLSSARSVRSMGAATWNQVLRSRSVAGQVQREGVQRMRRLAEQRAQKEQERAQRVAAARAQRAERARSKIPGGPGADLHGQDFHGRRLAFAMWSETNLQEARLDGALLDKADLRSAQLMDAHLVGTRLRDADLGGADLTRAVMEGARMRGAILTGATAHHARLVDVDLRRVDLQGADLSHADLSGADLRGARLRNANLQHANLTGARLPDVDLMDAKLDGAILEQADLAGVRWAGASVTGADLSGALGLSGAQREQLREWGAQVEDVRFERFLGQIGSRPAQAAVGLLAVGMGAYLTARFATSEVIDPARLEVEAKDLRTADPAEASQRYAELSALARRPEDKVGYLIEAAGLADGTGDEQAAEDWLREALTAAEDDPQLHGETKLHLATFLHSHQRFTDALAEVEPLIELVDQPTEQRARALVLYEAVRADLGLTDDDAREAVFSTMGDLPEMQAELRLALAELFANRGDTASAIEQVDAASALDLPKDIRIRLLATRARVFDRSGNLDQAIETWQAVHRAAAPDSLADQAARLATADLHLRQGRVAIALENIRPLLSPDSDERIRGRALIVSGRIHEKRGQADAALSDYSTVLTIDRLDTDTVEEARIALASLVLDKQGAEAAEALLADMAPDAVTEVMANARLGEARSHLDAGEAVKAHKIFEQLSGLEGMSNAIRRASMAGLGEALAQMGELRDALDIWRDLLAEENTQEERIQLELLLANGLLQGGKRKEAATAFRSLADSDNDDARVQGMLGLAEVARAGGERQRARAMYRQVADQNTTTAWRIRALQELADMATEDNEPERGVTLWRELLTSLPPSHPAAPDARLSLVAALMGNNNIEEALRVCRQAVDAAPNPADVRTSRVACAEVEERDGRWTEASNTYSAVLNDTDTPIEVMVDAALGAARTALASSAPEEANRAIGIGLARAEDPVHRLPLLAMRIQALRALDAGTDLRAAIFERDNLAEQAPEIAWLAFLESAGQARSRGDADMASELLGRALNLPIATEQRARMLVELGGALLDMGQVDAAADRFEQVLKLADDDPILEFHAGMGQAEILRRIGKPQAAAARMAKLTPPDEEERLGWLNARATALSEAEDPDAEAVWELLAGANDAGAETRFAALRGRADALLARDEFEQALNLYGEAEQIAPEPWAQGWAALGVAEAQAHLGNMDASTQALDLLREHSDPEVRMQAIIRRADIAADLEDWKAAIDLVKPEAAAALGPAWDASATSTRARALQGAGDQPGAETTWRALANRWPEEEEGFLPAWLGLARLAQITGDDVEAQRWARKAYRNAIDPGYRAQAKELVDATATQ